MEEHASLATKKVKQPPVLFSRTQAAIEKSSERLGGPVICYWNNSRGSVCSNDVIALNNILERLGQHDTLYYFIKSDGGNGQASLRMVNLLRQHCRQYRLDRAAHLVMLPLPFLRASRHPGCIVGVGLYTVGRDCSRWGVHISICLFSYEVLLGIRYKSRF